ncbi:MAG: DUF4347 domain-containing protein, partial [Pseudanabaenaceae cyanobacterium]
MISVSGIHQSAFSATTLQHLVIVDTGVANYQKVQQGVSKEAVFLVLHPQQDGIEQITAWLWGRQVHSLQILTHGSPGGLQLGNSQLNLANLHSYAAVLQEWQVTEIALYSCEVAAGAAGQQFIRELAAITGANVAASASKVGHSDLGGTWDLAVQTGAITMPLLIENEALVNYTGLLGDTQRVSVATGGIQATGGSGINPSISSDGRYVAFSSNATNLVTGDTNAVPDIFVHDRQTNTTQLVSVATNGTQANNASSTPSISSDGRYVVFASDTTNLVAGDTNGLLDIFVYDRQTNTTQRVSVDSSGNQANNYSYTSSISSDGRYVAFESYADNLVAGDTNNTGDIFVYDRQTNTTQRVSVDSSGTQAGSSSYNPSISSDGRYVAFASDATNLVEGDTNGLTDIFVYDRQTNTTQRVSVDSSGNQAIANFGGSYTPSISSDGRYVAFASDATNLVEGDTNGLRDIFV